MIIINIIIMILLSDVFFVTTNSMKLYYATTFMAEHIIFEKLFCDEYLIWVGEYLNFKGH